MPRNQSILVVEDEEPIRTGLVDVFVFHGFDVEWADDGTSGLNKALSGKFDMILLDVMLPGKNGFDICEAIRAQDRDQAIIMLTAKTAEQDIINGLRLGADDYVAKPFSVSELVLRVKAVLRRSRTGMEETGELRLPDGTCIDTRNLCGVRGDSALSFTRREMEMLEYLGAHSERPVPREELLAKVWGYGRNLDIETRTVDIHIAKLRRKLEYDPKHPCNLVTVRGAGYRLLIDRSDG
jgi:two-component system response regulator RegX3